MTADRLITPRPDWPPRGDGPERRDGSARTDRFARANGAGRAEQGAAVELIDAQVRDVVRREGIDPLRNPASVQTIVAKVVREYDERSLTGIVPPIGDLEAVSREVHDRVAGFGPLQRYLDDPAVGSVCQVASSYDQVRGPLLPAVSSP